MEEPGHRLRWKLCKAFGRFVDDQEFSEISREQWHWYNAMIIQDEREAFELQRDIAEYLASFWNAEAVEKMKNIRKSAEAHTFASDEEFDRQVIEEEYKNNKFVQAIQKINRMKDTNRSGKSSEEVMKDIIKGRKTKLPTDLVDLINKAG
nr:hypothetical protein 97 [bacterium]